MHKTTFQNRFFQPALVLLYIMLHMQLPNACAQTPNTFKKVFIFSLHEEIAKPSERKVEKALKQAKEQKADCIVMSLNTFGGQLDVADSIRTMLLNANLIWIGFTVCVPVVMVKKKRVCRVALVTHYVTLLASWPFMPPRPGSRKDHQDVFPPAAG